MMRLGVLLALCVAATACASSPRPGSDEVSFEDLTADPEAFDGRHVSVQSGFYSSFEASVLTSGFAESFPPQPTEPAIWVLATPSGGCLERAERVAWTERVRAEGTFRYDPEGGFGHLGAYRMALEDPALRCP